MSEGRQCAAVVDEFFVAAKSQHAESRETIHDIGICH
jgi:hypothetical protein